MSTNDTYLGDAGENHETADFDGGNDVFIGFGGNDSFVGGSGADKFIFTDKFEGHGEAKVVDFTIGEDSLHIISDSVTSFSDLTISYDAKGNAIFTDGADLTVKLIGVTQEDINTYGSDLFII